MKSSPKKQSILNLAAKIESDVILENLLANIPGHVYWKNKQGLYLGCNDKQAQSLGFLQGSDVVGKTDFELPWDTLSAQKFWENDRLVLETGQSRTVEESAKVNGKPATMLSLKAPLKDTKGFIIGVLGISVDISKQKEAESKLIQALAAAEAANQAKTEFLENMRHDIRTPLAGITGCAEAIKSLIQDPKQLKFIKDKTAGYY